MGIFSSIKSAGAKFFGFSKTAEEENIEKSEQLKEVLNKHNLDIKNLIVKVDEDAIKIWGEVKDLETKEKIILTIGSIEGITTVQDNLNVV